MHAVRDLSASTPGRLKALSRRTGATDFFAWWARELGSVVPRGARASLQRRGVRPVLSVEGDVATLWRPASRGGELTMEPVATIPLAGGASSAGAAFAAGEDRKVAVALPPRQALRRRLRLPAALEENLKQAVGYDLDRHTPFKADEVYFDVVVVDRDAARGEIVVELATARRAVVDALIARGESVGAEVVAVVPDTADAVPATRLNLLPDERRPQAGFARAWQVGVPLATLALLVAVAVAVPIWQKREYAIALGRSVDEARTQASVSERLRTELDRLAGDYNFVLERKFAFPAAVQVLDEITKLLPDDTWLTQMEMKTVARGKEPQRELLLRGESVNAGRLITAFEESQVFVQAAQRSPTTKIQPGPGEIFDLAAQLKPLPPPPATALAAPAAAPGAPAGATPPAPAAASSTPAQAPAPTDGRQMPYVPPNVESAKPPAAEPAKEAKP